MKHEAWVREAEQLGISITQEQARRLAGYEALLERIAVPRGMIATSDADRLWERHLLDGLRGVPEIPSGASVADIGSGAGIPGIPLAVALPTSRFVLIEPRAARAAFLEAVVDELGLGNVVVVPKRAADVTSTFPVCVARAFAPPVETWEAAQALLDPNGVLLYWAGRSFDQALLDEIGVPSRVSTHSDLARTGPLVIMGPQ